MRGKVGSGSTAFNLDRFLILHRQPQDVWSNPPGLGLVWIRTNRRGRARSRAPSNIQNATIPSARAIASEKDRDQASSQFLNRIRSDGGLADT
jgi:hypothetical protein